MDRKQNKGDNVQRSDLGRSADDIGGNRVVLGRSEVNWHALDSQKKLFIDGIGHLSLLKRADGKCMVRFSPSESLVQKLRSLSHDGEKCSFRE